MKKIIVSLILMSLVTWLGPIINTLPDWSVWVWRKQIINWTGYASFLLMSLVMLLAIRPRWLESPLDGLDKIYRMHKWAGISSLSLALIHYGVKLGKGGFIYFFGASEKVARLPGVFDAYRSNAKTLGEWGLWLLIVMIIITLWQRFPYHIWRYLHKTLAILYLIFVFHSIVLTPVEWWWQPSGIMIALAALIGTYCAILSLSSLISRKDTYYGNVITFSSLGADTIEIECQLPSGWAHHPGQFAFVTFDFREGAHPFTIANADQGKGTVRFAIKVLGDYTQKLTQSIKIGQPVRVVGPYGRFEPPRPTDSHDQVWIAAGIGATPFLAWLESLNAQSQSLFNQKAQLYYCAKNVEDAIFSQRFKNLTSSLPNVKLHIHLSDESGPIRAEEIFQNLPSNTHVWFCGPVGLAKSLKEGMKNTHLNPKNFHNELFKLR